MRDKSKKTNLLNKDLKRQIETLFSVKENNLEGFQSGEKHASILYFRKLIL